MLQKSDFYRDPKDFLKENVVRINGAQIKLNYGENPNQVYRFILQEDGEWRKVVDGTGKTVGAVYRLVRDDNAVEGINAYFCPYKKGETNWVTLGTAAHYMFTPQMDGCTFGIGNDAKGAVIAGHANSADVGSKWAEDYGKDAGLARQRAAQLNILRYKIKTNGHYIEPEQYMVDEASRATTFGVLRQDGWKFYTACFWTQDLETFQVRSVTSGIKGLFNPRLPKWLI
jgi:hypothetical protein